MFNHLDASAVMRTLLVCPTYVSDVIDTFQPSLCKRAVNSKTESGRLSSKGSVAVSILTVTFISP